MPDHRLEIGPYGFGAQIADIVRDARRLVGWSQRELADRAGTSQATVWRIETARADQLDLLVVERILRALGIRGTLDLDARHLADRRRQADGVHARVNGCVCRRLQGHAWLTATEVQLGVVAPRGWIDTLAFRPADRALLVEETKTEILDLGALQRSVAFYAREAPVAARALGWRPERIGVLVVALDTQAIADRVAANRDAFRGAFPGSVTEMAEWLRGPAAAPPRGWTLGVVDPASRARSWLMPSALTSRRHPTYVDYRDAARRLRLR